MRGWEGGNGKEEELYTCIVQPYAVPESALSTCMSCTNIHLQCQCLIQLNQREQAEIEAVTALEDHPHTPCLHLILATLYAQRQNTLQEVSSYGYLSLCISLLNSFWLFSRN